MNNTRLGSINCSKLSISLLKSSENSGSMKCSPYCIKCEQFLPSELF